MNQSSEYLWPARAWHCVLRSISVILLLLITSSPARLNGQSSALLDVVVVLDQSRSMRQSDPKRRVPKAFSDFIQQLPAENAAGLILFGSQAWSVQSLAPLAEEHRRQLLTSIADVRYSDAQSNPAAAVDAALDEFRNRGRREATPLMILLSDGGIDTGSKTRDSELQRLLETQVMAEVRRQKVKIYSIAFTTGADLGLLERISRESGGECFSALTDDALESSFGRLRAAMNRPTGSVPEQTAKPPESFKPSATSAPAAPSSKVWMVLSIAGLILLAAGGFFFFIKPKLSQGLDEPPPEATLVDLRTGKPFLIQKKTINIGRKSDNDLVIAERTVSAQHARIRYQKGKFYLEDLQSSNETKLNGEKIVGEVELRTGDVVRFDQFGFAFKGPEADPERTLLR